MVKVGSKRSVADIETDEVPTKKQRVSGVDSATLTQQESASFDSRSRELCQPWDIEQFFDRVRTFSAMNWFSKPEAVAPVICARYGWICSGANLISCQVCRQQHHFSMLNTLAAPAAQTLLDGFVETIKMTGHAANCPWRSNPCDESFLRLPTEEPLLRDIFQRNIRSYQRDGDGLFTLPRLDPSTREQIIAEIPESKETCNDTSDAMLLSVCGWKQRHCAPEANTNALPSAAVFLECRYCNRQLSLSQYEFYRTPSIALNETELDEEVNFEHQEDTDSKMQETSGPRSMESAVVQRSGPFSESFDNDNAEALAEKLKHIGIGSLSAPRSQWLSVYPSRALQNIPQFVLPAAQSFGVQSFLSSQAIVWPRKSHLLNPPEDTTQPAEIDLGFGVKRRKKRRRSSTPEPDERSAPKRARQSAADEKSFEPPPIDRRIVPSNPRRRGNKRKKPEPDDMDEDNAEEQHVGKRVRLSAQNEANVSISLPKSRKRILRDEDREPHEEPPPKKRRSFAPAVRSNRFFDPIREHRPPCPYISVNTSRDQGTAGWMFAARVIPRDFTNTRSTSGI